MLLSSLIIIPILGILIISSFESESYTSAKLMKVIALTTSIINLVVSLILFILFDFSNNQFQFVQEYHEIGLFDLYLGVDGLSIYFVLLTTFIMPIALLANWTSISENVKPYVVIMLLLESLLIADFLVLDILLFYIFFEAILPPLFIMMGLFGSNNRVRASFYFFLYTLWGSLFLLLSILTISSMMGTTDFDALYKSNINYSVQLLLFCGMFIAFAVKTPTIFLNSWLLKAHVESPLGGSIVLAAIVLKLAIYGIIRLMLPILPKACLDYTYIVYIIGVITIIYASFSTLRTIDVKELIAYSSVSHAAVYLLGIFSNTIQGVEGAIVLGLAHGFVSSGLFICAGGILYDRTHTRLITFYKGMAQIMPIFSILMFILSLGNAGTPLTLNFVGEFLSLYGAFERLPLLGAMAASSIVLSAAYTMFMFNRIVFGGQLTSYLITAIPDVNKREFYILLPLVVLTIIFGVYPSPILDGLHFNVSSLIYSTDVNLLGNTEMFALGSGLLCISAKKRDLHLKKDNNLSEIMRPHFVTGFTDGEGSFVITLIKSSSSPVGYKIQLSYRIGLHIKDLALIKRIKNFFNEVGNISSNERSVVYYVSSIKDLGIVINHFDKYPLITNKLADYILFKQAFTLISAKEHLTQEGFNQIIAIKSVINKGLSDELKNTFKEIPFIQRPIINLPDSIHPDWFAGFTSAEGCFKVKVQKNLTTKTGVQVLLYFQLTQHIRDELLLKSFATYFNCGKYSISKDREWGDFSISSFSDITDKIIPFFKKHYIEGIKAKDFEDFCEVAEIIKIKGHLTEEGYSKISKIKDGMNKGRLFSPDS